MSPEATAVNSFVGNLVEMAKAYETLPQVREDLDQANRTVNSLSQTVMQREERIASLKAEMEAQNERIRKLEAERDDAELRFLEADELASKVRALVGEAGSLLTPPKPEPTPIPEVVHSIEEAKPETYYTEPSKDWPTPLPADPLMADTMAEAPLHPALQGERASGESNVSTDHGLHPSAAPDPAVRQENVSSDTDRPSEVAEHTPTPAPSAQTGTGTENEASGSDDPTQRFVGKYYIDFPGYVSRSDWKAGGGTDESYDYRRPIDGAVI